MTKTVNVYNPTNNFKFKNWLFEATSTKEKYVSSGYGIVFDRAGSLNFNNGYARNYAIFGVDHRSSSHFDNHKNNFLILDEGPNYGINGTFGSPEKKVSINFTKANSTFYSSFYYNAYNSYCC